MKQKGILAGRAAFAAMSMAVAAFLPVSAAALDASSVLKRAAAAMGSTDLKTITYTADGWGNTFGQAFVPGAHWPRIQIHSMTRTIDYEGSAMREQITLSRAEPMGGGGYPLFGQQTNDQYINSGFAWNVVGGNAAAGPRFVSERLHQLWITPHGVLRAAARNNAKLEFKDIGGRSLAVLTYTEAGRYKATAYLNGDYEVVRVESRYPDAVLGEVDAVTTYSGYRSFNGVMFPSMVQQKVDGRPVLDLVITKAEPNVPVSLTVPDGVRSHAERVTTDKVADGVWFIAGGSHNSVAIEMRDHMVLVEAPLGDYRTLPVIDAVNKLAPGKAIRYVVNSHHHFDHTGGIRAAASTGATIVTQAKSKPYFEKLISAKNAIDPDALSKAGKRSKVMAIGDKGQLTDGKRVIELHRIKDSIHTDTFLMAYLPAEKLLIQADAFTPGPPGAKPPAVANANNVNLVENIERLKLAVDRILPLHGRVVPLAELYTAVGKTAPR
jgi:glyoxylase-like metal-dependent hydrolase (beta-lactamase superfamily II)